MKLRAYPFSWEPGWSYSRMNTLRICLRLYWYEYYAKRFAPAADRPKIAKLKAFSRIPFEVGNAVHQTIADLLEFLRVADNIPGPEDAGDMAVSKLDLLLSSKPLIERRLGVPITGQEVEQARENVRLGMNTFYAGRWLAMLREADFASRKGWHIDPPGFGEFRLDGKKAYAKPDLIFCHGGKNYLLEWKTGKPHREQNLVQVQAYLFYAQDIMGLELDETVGIVQYLTCPDEEPLEIRGREMDIGMVKDSIKSEIRLIESLCEDVTTNTPKAPGHFPRTEELGYCRLCNYREICRPDFNNNI